MPDVTPTYWDHVNSNKHEMITKLSVVVSPESDDDNNSTVFQMETKTELLNSRLFFWLHKSNYHITNYLIVFIFTIIMTGLVKT